MKFMIIGFGNMGKRHGRVLGDLQIPFSIEEPKICTGGINSENKFSHYIISSPNETHKYYYDLIRSFDKNAKILIEKPVVLLYEDQMIFEDKNMFCSSTRRFHPITKFIQENFTIDEIVSWVKCGPKKFEVPAILDLGIHCYDVIDYLMPYKSYDFIKKSVFIDYRDYKIDKFIFVDINGFVVCCDYISNTIIYNDEIISFEDNSIENQILAFIKGKICNTHKAHRICYELCKKT